MSYQYFNPERSDLALSSGTERSGILQSGSEPRPVVEQLRIPIRYRWTIVACAASAFALALLFSLLMHPEYDAVAFGGEVA